MLNLFWHIVWLLGDYADSYNLLPKRVKAAHTRLAFKLDLEEPYDSY